MHTFSQVTLYGALVGSCVIANAAPAQRQYSPPQLSSSNVGPASAQDTTTSRTDSALSGVRVSLNASERTVEQALLAVLKQAKLRVVYNSEQAAFARKFNRRIDNLPVMEAVSLILKGTGLAARIAPGGEAVLIRAESQNPQAAQQTGMIGGRVTDSATSRELVGVTVVVRGTRLSATTNERGLYVIPNVPLGSYVLDIRMLGFRSLSRTVDVQEGKRTQLNVVMSATATALSEVVTSVTGTQRKIEIGNDVTTINVDSVIRTAPITSVSELLDGRVPGLTVVRASGIPGAPSRLRLRGIGGGLISNVEGAPTNDPIVIVDGIRINASQSGVGDQNLAMSNKVISSLAQYSKEFPPSSAIDQIDPNSIDRIDIYKGPSAAAMYGSDAANGVIVITTKRGQNGTSQWSGTTSYGTTYYPGTYTPPGFYVFCSGNVLTGGTSAICSDGGPVAVYGVDSIVRFQALDIPSLTPFGRGHRSEQSLTLSGGQGQYAYSITGSMSDELGALKMPTLYQRQYFTLYDSAAPEWMKRPNSVSSRNVNASFSIQPRRGLIARFVTRLTQSRQLQSSAQLQLPTLASEYTDTATIDPARILKFTTRSNNRRGFVDFSTAVNWDVLPFLPISATLGTSRDNRNETRLDPNGLFYSQNALTTRGFYSGGNEVVNVQSITLSGTLFPARRISTAMGFQVTTTDRQRYQGRADSLSPGVTVPSAFTYGQQASSKIATGGWFVEPRLNLNSRFFVNPGFRFDGNTTSGKGGGLWDLFPKLNFSWIALERAGASQAFGFISMLRPRLSLGIAGVQPAPGAQLRLLTIDVYGSNRNMSDLNSWGLGISHLGNTKLRPERTREIEAGFDVDMLDGRVSLSVSQFHKLREDAIEQISLPPSVYGGDLPQYKNIGRIRNTGTEMSVTAAIIENPTVRWAVTSSFSRYTNTLLKLSGERPYIDMGNGSRYMAGYPINGRWERPIVGYQATAASRLRYTDVIIADSAVYVGQQSPNFTLPVHTTLSLFQGMVGVSASFNYKDGMTQMNSGSQQTLANLYFNPSSTYTEQAVALAAACITDAYCSKYGLVQTVNTLRFQSFSVSYRVPRHIGQRFRVPSLEISLQGSNLGLWTNYRGKDPEVNSITVGDATEDNGTIPQARTWRLQMRFGN